MHKMTSENLKVIPRSAWGNQGNLYNLNTQESSLSNIINEVFLEFDLSCEHKSVVGTLGPEETTLRDATSSSHLLCRLCILFFKSRT